MVERRLRCGAQFCRRQQAHPSNGHTIAGQYGVFRTLKAIKNRFYWPTADMEVRHYVCNCHSCQVQTPCPARPSGLLQPSDVPPYAWHTVITERVTGLPLTP